MPRERKLMRSDGVPGRTLPSTGGQPNGRLDQSDVPTGLPYGEGGALRGAIANTAPPPSGPPPPGIDPAAHGARQALAGMAKPGLTPLFAPTERPGEHVLTGAVGGMGPPNPMAMPQNVQPTVSDMLGAMANSSPALRLLMARASAIGQ